MTTGLGILTLFAHQMKLRKTNPTTPTVINMATGLFMSVPNAPMTKKMPKMRAT
jgi:hypothetical protein